MANVTRIHSNPDQGKVLTNAHRGCLKNGYTLQYVQYMHARGLIFKPKLCSQDTDCTDWGNLQWSGDFQTVARICHAVTLLLIVSTLWRLPLTMWSLQLRTSMFTALWGQRLKFKEERALPKTPVLSLCTYLKYRSVLSLSVNPYAWKHASIINRPSVCVVLLSGIRWWEHPYWACPGE